MAHQTVLAVDIGSTTITAAVAGGEHSDPQFLHPNATQAVWPAQVNVADDGTLVTDPSAARTVISRITRLLGREAQVIAGQPRHADTLIAAALAPVLTSAKANVESREIDVVAATYPSTWPEDIVDAFRRAVERFAPGDSMLIPWHEAIAAQTYPPDPYVACPVTSLDFGARSASVTMVDVDAQGRAKSLYSITNPTGGFSDVARAVIYEVADAVDTRVDTLGDAWWETAVSAVAAGRAEAAAHGADQIVLALPDPLRTVKVGYDEVTDMLVERLTGVGEAGVILQLVERAPVKERWTIPGNPRAAKPIVQLTGGFSGDPAVQTAVSQVLGIHVDVIDEPGHAAAWGAAKIATASRNRLLASGGAR